MYNTIKRILDLLLFLLLLPLFTLVLIIFAVLIKAEDGGPAFYLGKRLGMNGKVFLMYKFRTMMINAPDIRNEDGSTFNSDDDPRLTKIGKFLRQTSIDELPQILNVLSGDMSFIGPRPDLPEHINIYNEHQKLKLKVRPGISGYNQAYFRNSVDWFERIENDIYYVNHLSLWLDIKVFFKTIWVVVRRDGIYANGEAKKQSGTDNV